MSRHWNELWAGGKNGDNYPQICKIYTDRYTTSGKSDEDAIAALGFVVTAPQSQTAHADENPLDLTLLFPPDSQELTTSSPSLNAEDAAAAKPEQEGCSSQDACLLDVEPAPLCTTINKGGETHVLLQIENTVAKLYPLYLTYERTLINVKLYNKLQRLRRDLTFIGKAEDLHSVPNHKKVCRAEGRCNLWIRLGNRRLLHTVYVLPDLSKSFYLGADFLV
ncbi:UNVERIFIED_CONTAM: hypothetical protein FKN15_002477 [Acipenser sinensis]